MSAEPERSKIYYELAELPTYTSAQFIKRTPSGADLSFSASASAQSLIRVTTSVSDHSRNIKRSLSKYVSVSADKAFPTPSQDLSDAVASYLSPSGSQLVVLRESHAEESNEKKRFVEVWRGDVLQAIKDVTKLHGSFYTDEVFATSGYGNSENAFVYTAEANAPEGSDSDPPYDKYQFTSHFGERYIGKKRASLFVVEWNGASNFVPVSSSSPDKANAWRSKQLSNLTFAHLEPQGLADNKVVSYGQTVLDEKAGAVFATGYEHTPDGRFLGIVGCHNRPSGIYRLHINKQVATKNVVECKPEKLTPAELACRSPRVIHHNGKSILVYLAQPLGGPHHSCAQLRCIDLETKEDRVLVDTVWDADISRDEFPGLYVDQLPHRPFLLLKERPHVILHSLRTYYTTVYIVDLETSECKRVIDPDRGLVYSWLVLSTDDERSFLCSRSRTDVPSELMLCTFEEKGDMRIRVIDKPYLSKSVARALDRLCQSTYHLPAKPHVESVIIETIDDTESTSKIKPAIMVPHGGPHGTSTNAFNAMYAALALENFTIFLPNYTGSLGYGLKYVKELIGKCGVLDVDDCLETAKGLVKKETIKEGVGWQFVYGGSHGGFLAAHLIGQYPTYFSGAVLRNPVTSVGELPATSDIPDWGYEEFGMPYSYNSKPLDSATFAFLARHSPMAHAFAVIAPVLVLLGDQDQRVPPSQGRNYYHVLKGQNKNAVEMLVFPGNGHPLDKVEAQCMSFEAVRDWFNKYRY